MTSPDFVDVSDNNGLHVDWNAVAASGVHGAICKAVQATGAPHPGFAQNWPILGDLITQGRLQRRGAYNFCQAGDPVAEARALVSTVNAAGGFTHPSDFAVMDLERPGIDNNWAYTALLETSSLSGRPAWLYCSYGFLVGPLRSDRRLANFPLWIADINATLPALAWPHALWQYTWGARVPGIQTAVDGSRYGPAYPSTLPVEDDMPLTPADLVAIEKIVEQAIQNQLGGYPDGKTYDPGALITEARKALNISKA